MALVVQAQSEPIKDEVKRAFRAHLIDATTTEHDLDDLRWSADGGGLLGGDADGLQTLTIKVGAAEVDVRFDLIAEVRVGEAFADDLRQQGVTIKYRGEGRELKGSLSGKGQFTGVNDFGKYRIKLRDLKEVRFKSAD